MRDYIKEKLGEAYLVPLLFHTQDPADIKPENLPDTPHIIKTNHNSGGGAFIVRDKSHVDFEAVRKSLRTQLKRNYYHRWKEWQYKNIEPRIVVEKLLLEGSDVPNDYKFHCFNGKVAFIQVDLDRFTGHKRNLYDPDWTFIDCAWKYENGPDIPAPPKFDEMKALAETVAQDFRLVRVDFYNIEGDIYFGELTFHPEAGVGPFSPPEWDRRFGEQLTL